MAVWELVCGAIRSLNDGGGEWVTTNDVVRAVRAVAPGTNVGTVRLQLKAHSINDPSKDSFPAKAYLRNPQFVTDDPTMRGKRYRLLSEQERQSYLRHPRTDLERFSYTQLLDWLSESTAE